MKGRVFGWIVLTTMGVAIMSYMGYLGGDTVQVKAHYVEYTCGDKNMDLKVTAVSDSSMLDLIGKTISPEVSFSQSKLNEFLTYKMKNNKAEEFLLVGHLKKGPVMHCSGSACFKVQMIKQERDEAYTKF